MAEVALELVDAGLIAARGGNPGPPSPGIALLEPTGPVVGRAAAAQMRLKPVLVHDRYWSDLSTDPLPRPARRARSTADLAYAQLVSIWGEAAEAGDEALMVVPGTLNARALGLLGGIAAAAGVPVAGFVDAAVAAVAGRTAHETVLHIDLQLHQAVLTELKGTTRLSRRRVEAAPRVGLKLLHASWAQLIAEAMVRRTRFDPLHQAATEQQLHDRLPEWLGVLAEADAVDVELAAAAGTFGVTLQKAQFAFAAEAYYAQLLDLVHAARRAGTPVTVALSARAASLPGFAERCASLGEVEVIALEEGAAALGALAAAAAVRSEGDAALVVALPRSAPLKPEAARGGPRGERPTHVVHAGRAQSIGAEALEIGIGPCPGRALLLPGPAPGISRRHCSIERDGEVVVVRDHSRYGTFVNGERVEDSTVLAAGDRLRVGTPGIVLELVAAG